MTTPERATDGKKLITVVVNCYNEVDNVVPMHDAIADQFEKNLPNYEYKILFADNFSTDGTRDKLRLLCMQDHHTQAILNTRNFGQFNSPFHAMCEAQGDAVIKMVCDFQEPVDLIPRFVKEWENGHEVVCGIKSSSEENKVMRFLRTCYYKLIKKMSNVDLIEHFTGTGLYDRSFIEVLKQLDDPQPFLRGIVAELGPATRKDIVYKQAKRAAGKTHNNFATLYDAAMLSFTSYTKAPLRVMTIFGAAFSMLFLIIAILLVILWFMHALPYVPGSTPILLAVLFIGSIEMFSIGLLGEYVLTINSRTMKRPLVIEQERLGEW